MKILRELSGSTSFQWNVRESFSDIARKLEVDEETVRKRVNKARERGLLPTWRVMVNPQLIDCRIANVDLSLREEAEKANAISKIKTLNGVNGITDFRGSDLFVRLYYENDASLANSIQQIKSICQLPNTIVWESLFPSPGAKMVQLDWGIINEIESDARRDLEEVAQSLGVTSRTVQRRLSSMVEAKAVYLVRPPNVSMIRGLMCHFVIFCPDPNKKRAADLLIQSSFNRVGISDSSSVQYTWIGISCENFAEADRILDRLKSIEGVESVKMRFVNEIIVVPDWLRAQIAKRL